MEITKRNFASEFPKILPLLKEATFISFDGEFSGLGRGQPGCKFNDLDTPAERYIKTRHAVVDYGLIQLGITIFRYCPKDKKFFTSTFSFLIAGKEHGNYKVDTSSMTFLAENGFDFNKLYLEGLPFLTLKEETEIREGKAKKDLEDVPISTPVKIREDKAKKFVIEAKEKVENAIENKEKSVIFSGKTLNAFYRKLLYNNVAPVFPNVLVRSCHGNDHNIEALIFDTILEKEIFCGSAWEDNLNYEMGVTRVVKAILEANKPLVGHNVVLDVLHFVDKFVMELPQTFGEFRKIVRDNIPDMFDTKLLAKDPPFSSGIVNTALNPLYEELTSNYGPISIETEEGFKSYTFENEDGQYHEAGFDAFMTGVCFLTMVKVMEGPNWGKKPMMDSKKLEIYRNKINFMCSYDIPFIDIHNSQKIPDRSSFITVICPTDFNSNHTRTLLAMFDSYRLVWVTETLFHVIPQNDDEIKDIDEKIKEMRQVAPPNVSVQLYNDYTNKMKKQKKCISLPVPETCISPPENCKSQSEKGDAGSLSTGNKLETNGEMTGKRRSNDEGGVVDSDVQRRDLKRLKSIGSEQLSNLTLESPLNENKTLLSLEKGATKSGGKDKKVDEFAVPDDW